MISTWMAGGLLALGLGTGTTSSPSPPRFSRAEVAGCQLGCDAMRDDQLRATCKLRCFEDPKTAVAPSSTGASTGATTGATTPTPNAQAQPQPQPTAQTPTPSPSPPKDGKLHEQTRQSGGRSPSEVAHCQHQCDANLSLSDTDRATCRLGCESKGAEVTSWSVSGSPAQVRCAKKCHCESSCRDDLRRCKRSCNTMSNANAAASCSLQCDNELSPCERSCQPSAPTPDCSCG